LFIESFGVLEMNITQSTILEYIADIEAKLAHLRQALASLPETEAVDLSSIMKADADDGTGHIPETTFSTLRQAWDIPETLPTVPPITEIQAKMAQKLPENWASQEIKRLRES
jgi:site-specific recombinase XerD